MATNNLLFAEQCKKCIYETCHKEDCNSKCHLYTEDKIHCYCCSEAKIGEEKCRNFVQKPDPFPEVLENDEYAGLFLSTLPRIYLVACWARYGVLSFAATGLYTDDGIPLVYQHRDYNGCADLFELVPITFTTTGGIKTWTYNKEEADEIADDCNRKHGWV